MNLGNDNAAPRSAAEQALVCKLDWRIMPFVTWLYLLSFLDRVNLSNVHNDIIQHIGLTETQFASAISIFYIGYILCEIPSNLILKRAPPNLWIGLLVLSWGIVSSCMIFADTYEDLLVLRAFLGIAESGFFPGIVLFLTFWYRQREQALRIAIFYSSSAFAGAFGGIIAYSVLQQEFANFEPWQVLFLVEGIPSVVFGVVTWFVLPTRPMDSKWLTEEERQLAINRLHAHVHTKHSDLRQVLQTLINVRVILFAVLYLGFVAPLYSISFYLPTIIGAFGHDKITSNLMSVPVYCLSAIIIIVLSWHSDKTGERPWHLIIPTICAAIGYLLVGTSSVYNLHTFSYIGMFIAAPGVTCLIPVTLAWLTNSMKNSTGAAAATGFVVGFGNLGGVIGPSLYGWLYVPPQAPGETGSFAWAHFAMAASLSLSIIAALSLMLIDKRDRLTLSRTQGDGDSTFMIDHSNKNEYALVTNNTNASNSRSAKGVDVSPDEDELDEIDLSTP